MQACEPVNLFFEPLDDMVFVMSADSPSAFRYEIMAPAAQTPNRHAAAPIELTVKGTVGVHALPILSQHYRQAVSTRRPVTFMLEHDERVAEWILIPALDFSQDCSQVIGTVRDVTDKYRREQELMEMAHHDPLTGLQNRHGFEESLSAVLREARKSATLTCIFMIDVDNLKVVNDSFGHVTGDLYLKTIADRLQNATRSDDIVSRLGGDEFVIVANVTNESDAVKLADRILQFLAIPWIYERRQQTISVSMGIAAYPVHGESPIDVIRTADQAMYAAKRMGGCRYLVAQSPKAESSEIIQN